VHAIVIALAAGILLIPKFRARARYRRNMARLAVPA
jgi:hypothetical protein